MTDLAQWQQSNAAYLVAAVGWIRLCLARLASTHHRPAAPPAPPRRGFLYRWLFGDDPAPLPVSVPPVPTADEVAAARAAMDQAAKCEPAPAALVLQQRLGLSDFELHVLLLCAAVEFDTGIAALCARAHGDSSRGYPTYALALALFPDPAWDALSPERPLRAWRLIEISQPAGTPLTASPLRADERIVNYLKGLNQVDDRLAAYLTLLWAPGMDQPFALPPSQAEIANGIVATLAGAGRPGLLHLLGPDSPGKQGVAGEVAKRLSMALYLLPADVLPASPAELEAVARTWRRETLLLPVGLYLDAREVERDYPPVARFLARSSGLVFLDTRENWRHLQRETLTLDVDRPTRTEQLDVWSARLGEPETAALLASQFNLSLPEIHRAADLGARPGPGSTRDRLWDACRSASRPRLDLLAQRLEAKATWDDMVLPPAETAALREIATHARQRVRVYDDWGFAARMNRGLGVSALFSGESGTGKTMAAEVIANELRLNLYRIDLSAVVSKYIGETEKNLRQVFDAAEDGGSILFFDEADALFGKRSEVKDSHDRYANIEINYLLQRMEAYSGLAILATNLKNSLDTAFLRRLRFIVQFPFPAPAERRRIWERAFPAALPRGPLDFDFLARINVAGGGIHNIALKAAFLAANKRAPVDMETVLEAARSEFRKLERPINEAEFRWQPKRGEAVA